MENNENNVENQVKEKIKKKEAPKGNAAKGFVVAALLIVFLAIGFGLGFLIAGKWNPFEEKKNNTAGNNTVEKTENNDYELNNVSKENMSKIRIENIWFYVPNEWDCKCEKVEKSNFKLNADDEYYQVLGLLDDKYSNAFDIVITKDESYSNSSWVFIGETDDGRKMYRFTMFQVLEDGNEHGENEYKFEKETKDAMASIMYTYKINNEFGSANENKVLEGKAFIRGQAGTHARAKVYYIDEKNCLKRVSLTDGFETDILADYTASIIKMSDGRIFASPIGDSFDNNINGVEDEFVIFSGIGPRIEIDDRKVVDIKSEMIDQKRIMIEGVNSKGETVWSYVSPKENYPFQIVNEGIKIIEKRNDKVYVCDWGKLYILNLQYGDVLAKNTDTNIGAASTYVFDENGNLYTVSYLSAINMFDSNAKLIRKTDEAWNNGLAWPKKMTIDGNKLIVDYGEEGSITLNKDTLEVININKY